MSGHFFAGSLPAGTSGFVGGSTLSAWGLEIVVTADDAQLNGYWWYVPVGADAVGADYSAKLFTTTDGKAGTAVTGSAATGSGTWAAGWNYIPLDSPVSLSSGGTYVAALYQAAAGSIQFAHNFWSTGAGASGIVGALATAPGAAAALNSAQQPFSNPATAGQFPATVNQASFYGLDVDLSTGGTPATVPGAPAAQSLAAPAGVARAAATVAGAAATTALRAPGGSAAAGATVTGAPAAQELAAPAGAVRAGVTVAGVAATTALRAPAGSAGPPVVAAQGTVSIVNAPSATVAIDSTPAGTVTIVNTL
jgi:hypothetical protein